ncbi:aminoglycoside 6-adenylyltransferase [Dictyobacter alpinus]|uniref:Aminoglycoside 6-adenylyltransferase n=1 Tax=Dictyobacter alpinus TaxID=2014873 RepID=A0A402BIY0_9CHLR|nr:aminoglycoside 6-adenylyltransferase [Dictyobacter alpinus]GCE31296.1 aminoglycoside 6-adenylyltransferase [Dictyobacter alpinus]
MSYEALLNNFLHWSEQQDDIRVVFIVGSRGREDHPADEWADLDIIFVTTQPYNYVTKTDWLYKVGTPWMSHLEPFRTGEIVERRVLFAGGLAVDFAPLAVDMMEKLLAVDLLPLETVILPGIHVVLDKDGYKDLLLEARERLQAQSVQSRPPHNHEFSESINDFWYHAYWVVKKWQRGELWSAKWCLDVYMKQLLLHMLEWHARATRGRDAPVKNDGRFLEEWADPRALEELPTCFAHYEHEDMRIALNATCLLYSRIAREAAHLLHYTYPNEIEERISQLLEQHQLQL